VPLTSGQRLGPYEILSAAGAGGMGEVYKARDTRLDRTVAIKVLPQQLTANADLKQRFEREARTISGLQHPNICTLFDVGSENGVEYLVMEYIEGETLAKRLERGPTPTKELIQTGGEIAGALEKAHRSGIIHRDLKPANIMLTKSGAKLLDFGLAKPMAFVAAAQPAFSAATMTAVSPITQAGSIVGTVQYMSPEQVEGKEADARSDIFALGCVLYEMAAGKRAFDGKSNLSVASAILEKEPEPISSIHSLTPPALEHVVMRALAKDPEERWQTASDLGRELKWVGQASTSTLPLLPLRRRRHWRTALVPAALAFVALIAGFALAHFYPQTKQVVRVSILPPEGVNIDLIGDFAGPPVLSPNGKMLAFVGHTQSGGRSLWIRHLDSLTAQQLGNSQNATFPFWSPDSKQIAFFQDGKLKKTLVSGGPIVTLADAMNGRGGSWGSAGVIIFAPEYESQLYRVNAEGGPTTPATLIDRAKHSTHRFPWFMPDGKHFIYLATSHAGGDAQQNGIYFASLDGGQPKLVQATDSQGEFAEGRLIFLAPNFTLVAQKFDPVSGVFRGEPQVVATDVEDDTTIWRADFTVTDSGVLAYNTGLAQNNSKLVWLDRTGKQVGLVGDSGEYLDPSLSPDGKHIAYIFGNPSRSLWVQDLTTGTRARLTFDVANHFSPSWSRDGKRIIYASNGAGASTDADGIYSINADGSGQPAKLVSEMLIISGYPELTRDNATVVYIRHGKIDSIVAKHIADGAENTVVTAPTGSAQITFFQLSPNNRYLAYGADENGQVEVYVVPFPTGSGKWQVSPAGGIGCVWRGDGKEIYFAGMDSNFYAAQVDSNSPEFHFFGAKPLFPYQFLPAVGRLFDVRSDGQRFVFNVQPPQSEAPLVLYLNWTDDLK